MAFVTADRVRDTSTTAGSGSFSVSGTAPTGYRTFSAVLSVSDTFYYSIQHQTLNEWEVGLGTYSSANTFSRTTIYSSSNAGSAVTFSAGTKDVFITMVASKSPQLDPSGNVTALGTPASATLTNATGLSLTTGVTGVLPSANGGSLAWQSVQTANFTAVAGRAYWVNTTAGAITVTLPASPSAGQVVQLTDYAGTWVTNNVTVGPNGGKINASTSNVVISSFRGSVAFVYADTTQGWVVYSGFNATVAGSTYNASYLVVGGGGSGGSANSGGIQAGGGGAGGLLTGSTTLTVNTIYGVIVGAGGTAPAPSSTSNGTNGTNSSISTLITAIGGGGGAGGGSGSSGIGLSGGSGGGGGSAPTGLPGGSATTGQGFNGGTGSSGGNYSAGGGGGASAVGGNGNSGGAAGAGGAGSSTAITGTLTTYAGGGGGGSNTAGQGAAGGSGGGGGGVGSGNGTAGTANTGGGGGGSGNGGTGGNGGSGIVVLLVPTASYSGTTTGSPTVTTSGPNTIIKFTASGSYTA